jgi:hypothetical protein
MKGNGGIKKEKTYVNVPLRIELLWLNQLAQIHQFS